MATKITVNGTTITVQNRAVSRENAFAGYDEVSSAIATGESAVMVDVMSMAYESMLASVTAQAQKSGEAFSDKMKKAGAKIAAGAKRVWEAICNFFRNLIQSIEAFITGGAIKMRAKSILAKLDKNGLNEKARVKGSSMKGSQKLTQAIVNASNKLNGVPDAKCETSDEVPELNNIEQAVKAVEAEMAKFGSFQEAPADTTLNAKDVFEDSVLGLEGKAAALTTDNVRKFLQTIVTGGTGIFKELIVARDESKKSLAKAQKEAMKAAKNDSATKKELVRKYKLSTKINNMRYKLNVKCIQQALNAAAAMVNANIKDDSKAYEKALKKNAQ